MGRLARDPELKYTNGGKQLCTFSVAQNDRKDQPANFFDCVAWEKTAELINQYLKKGSQILIEGSIKIDKWQEKETGKNRTKYKVNVYRFEFVGCKNNDNNQQEQQEQKNTISQETVEDITIDEFDANDMPF